MEALWYVAKCISLWEQVPEELKYNHDALSKAAPPSNLKKCKSPRTASTVLHVRETIFFNKKKNTTLESQRNQEYIVSSGCDDV